MKGGLRGGGGGRGRLPEARPIQFSDYFIENDLCKKVSLRYSCMHGMNFFRSDRMDNILDDKTRHLTFFFQSQRPLSQNRHSYLFVKRLHFGPP